MENLILLTIIPLTHCNWESEWLVPIQGSYSKESPKKISDDQFKIFGDETIAVTSIYENRGQKEISSDKDIAYGVYDGEGMSSSLTDRLRNVLQNAKALAESLKNQIVSLASREHLLKETIVNGRSGVTVLNLMATEKVHRTYIIRDGFWTLCNGMVQYPTNGMGSANIFNELFAAPRCIGQEVYMGCSNHLTSGGQWPANPFVTYMQHKKIMKIHRNYPFYNSMRVRNRSIF